MMKMVKTGWPPLTHTFLAWSLSSIWPRSLPLAWAILFPDTRFPTITDAGPISVGEEEGNMRERERTCFHRTTTHSLVLYLAVSAVVWAGWWRRCAGTWARCRGAAPPPGTAAWSLTGGCHPEEFWAECWRAPEPGSTPPPDGYRLLPGKSTRVSKNTLETNKWHLHLRYYL